MAKIDLTSQEWIDLVFEGRNQAYGAYEMRKNSAKRHNVAMVIVLIIAIIAFSLPALIRYVVPEKAEEKMTEVTKMTNLKQAEVKKNEELKPLQKVEPPPPLKSSIKFTPPVVTKDENVKEEIKSQDELQKNDKVTISIADVKGNDEINGKDIADFKEVIKPEAPKEVIEKPILVAEQMPMFPGGEAEMMAFIQKNLNYPVIAKENGISGRVIIQFVVSKTGDIQDVKILRGLDAGCDREALRVVKMMPRWTPGRQNGNPVPVFIQIPVLFKLI